MIISAGLQRANGKLTAVSTDALLSASWAEEGFNPSLVNLLEHQPANSLE